jgi:hypothetical protein
LPCVSVAVLVPVDFSVERPSGTPTHVEEPARQQATKDKPQSWVAVPGMTHSHRLNVCHDHVASVACAFIFVSETIRDTRRLLQSYQVPTLMIPPVLLCAERVVEFPKAASVSATIAHLGPASSSSFTLLPPAALFQTMICGEDPSRRYPRMLRIVSLFP